VSLTIVGALRYPHGLGHLGRYETYTQIKSSAGHSVFLHMGLGYLSNGRLQESISNYFLRKIKNLIQHD